VTASPPVLGSRRTGTAWLTLAALELALATYVVIGDLLLPSLVLLVVAGVSLLVRRDRPSTFGLVRPEHGWRQAGVVLALTAGWSLVQLGLVIPVLEHATGERQDVSMFADVEGNVGLLLALVALSWTLAAFPEELGFRGYLQARAADLLGSGRLAVVAAVLFSSALFGLLHTEQGVVGVGATFVDGLFFSVLMRRSQAGLWAAVLAHGFNNTLGLTAYFLVGPIHGFW
jgi:membrane protease YdiL (CAAX protease family)